MRTHAGIILQARYGSTRLRGKALATVGGRTILEQCLRRLIQAGVARVVLATTTSHEDDALDTLAKRMGVLVYRGQTDDVLGRFSEAARLFNLDPVLRATADNPAVDVQSPGRVLAALQSTEADYIREEGMPLGASVEGMTAEALHRAARLATDPYDREHVTTFIRKRRDLFRVTQVEAPAPLARPWLRLTVDTAEDLAWVRELFDRTGAEDPSLSALIAASGCRKGAAASGDSSYVTEVA
jgi:spore coat polysaccharide biosynthesis protein SpsF (cytidylyltransferase family)